MFLATGFVVSCYNNPRKVIHLVSVRISVVQEEIRFRDVKLSPPGTQQVSVAPGIGAQICTTPSL